ncbi:MAG: hypothetical protein ABIT38_03925 [Gemmatimonadaceae bacterium]
MKTKQLLLGVLSVGALLVTACSTDSVTAPTAASFHPVATSASAADEAAKDARKAAHEALMAQRDSIRKMAKERKKQLHAQLEILRADWKQFNSDWKQQLKADKFARLELLRCEPLEYDQDAEVIGPEGGTLRIGPHQIVIPKGALTEEKLIVGEAPMGQLVEVDFGPHGLNFLSSAQLTLSYGHCLVPVDFNPRLAYVGSGLRILELPPSKDAKTEQKVVGFIDHFSSYMIAY